MIFDAELSALASGSASWSLRRQLQRNHSADGTRPCLAIVIFSVLSASAEGHLHVELLAPPLSWSPQRFASVSVVPSH